MVEEMHLKRKYNQRRKKTEKKKRNTGTAIQKLISKGKSSFLSSFLHL